MPAKPSGEIKKAKVKVTQKNGDIYIFERESVYIPEKKYNRIIRSKLLAKIPKGTEMEVKTRPKAPSRKNVETKSDIIDASRQRVGMMTILEQIGKESGIDDALYNSTDIGVAQKIISLARYWIGTNGATLPGIATWQYNHPLPYEDGFSEEIYHDLFLTVGRDEKLQQSFFQQRCQMLSPNEGIAYDSTTISTYSVNQEEARKGFNKEGDGLNTIKLLTIYSIKHRQPIVFTKQPGNLSDVTSIVNAIKQLEVLGVNRPEIITDNGYYSDANISALFQSRYHFITLADKNAKWIRKIIDEVRDQMGDYSTAGKGNLGVYGTTVNVTRTYTKERQRGSQKRGIKAGETEEFERNVHVHVYFDDFKRTNERVNFISDLQKTEEKLMSGVDFSDLSSEEQKLASEYFTLKKKGKKITIIPNSEAIKTAKPYQGFFVLLSSQEKDTWKCLEKYRRRNTIEWFFEAEKGRVDGRRPRVWSSDSFRGRLFVQFIALSYYEYLNEKTRKIQESLGCKTGDAKHDTTSNLEEERKLKAWMENTPLYLQLQWFDTIETISISSKLKNKRWNTETTKRDRLYLEKLGISF